MADPSRTRRQMRLSTRSGIASRILVIAGAAGACLAFATTFVVSSPAVSGPRCRGRGPLVARRVADAGGAGAIEVIRPKATGFGPTNVPKTYESQMVVAGFSRQKSRYVALNEQGFPSSEVFARFENKTTWRKLGEVISTTGDFEEAIRAQWTLLISHSYYLSRKFRFHLVTTTPIQFGYADENAEIVPILKGPLHEAFPKLEMQAMLLRCGFVRQEKQFRWLTASRQHKIKVDSKKDWALNKPHLLNRERNRKLSSLSRYNPDKIRRLMISPKQKRGIVVGITSQKGTQGKSSR
mmetsp:Transcript_34800/g.75869  ORF Transcript_34800/g.75869 Transcript_34800/m.75869 type:complete len:295 (+) Transcript_34800:61-945(+)